MSEAGHGLTGAWDVESLLSDALRPIEPPERLSGRLEDTLSAVTQAAAEELSDWAESSPRASCARCATRATGCARCSRSARAGLPPAPSSCWRCAGAASGRLRAGFEP